MITSLVMNLISIATIRASAHEIINSNYDIIVTD
jgi:hypothetical protein